MEIHMHTLLKALDDEKTITLATCADNRVTIRPMSHVRRNRDIYFQTGKESLKMLQIAENLHVAICCGTFEIEGTASVHGHPLDMKNQWFAEMYNAKHPEAFAKYSALTDEILVGITMHRVRQWQYINGTPSLVESTF